MTPKSILTLVIVVLAVLGLLYYSGGSASLSDSFLTAESNPEAKAATARIVALLNQIQALEIDNTLFESNIYRTFQDNSVPVFPQDVGRPNPFAPIPGVSASGADNS